jgi:hypothetical protein
VVPIRKSAGQSDAAIDAAGLAALIDKQATYFITRLISQLSIILKRIIHPDDDCILT